MPLVLPAELICSTSSGVPGLASAGALPFCGFVIGYHIYCGSSGISGSTNPALRSLSVVWVALEVGRESGSPDGGCVLQSS